MVEASRVPAIAARPGVSESVMPDPVSWTLPSGVRASPVAFWILLPARSWGRLVAVKLRSGAIG